MNSVYAKVTSDPRVRQYLVPVAGAFVALQARALNHYVVDTSWDWKKEIVVITGGASGIGAATATLLASKEMKVIVLDREEPQKQLLSSVHFYPLDITNHPAVSSTCARIRSDHGDPKVLINNAALGFDGVILDVPMDDVRKIFETNLFSHYALIKELLPDMVKHDHGHIVTVASIAAFATRAANVVYAATKAAALAWHDGIGLECALYYNAPRIRTTVVHPGFVNTPMLGPLKRSRSVESSMIEPENVATQVVDQLYSGNSGQIFSPPHMSLAAGVRGFPHWLQQKLWIDLSASMKGATMQSKD